MVPISNWNTLQLRSLIKDISKFYRIPFTEVNQVTSRMLHEATPKAKKKHGITAGVYNPTFEEVMEFSESLGAFLKKYPHIKEHINALYGQVRSCSRHAGGIVVGEDLDTRMPLINSGGVRQTPWSEGQNVRHLEPMGFIKFDILGLGTLRMIETAIRHILKRHHNIEEPTFEQVRKFYNERLHPDTIDFNDQNVFKNVFHKGRWAGIFQFTEPGAQKFCVSAKPESIIDIAAITSIFRPGPLSAGVDKHYVNAKVNHTMVKYLNDTVRSVTDRTPIAFGTSLNTSQDMVSISPTPFRTACFHISALGCLTTIRLSGWLPFLTRSPSPARRRQLISLRRWALEFSR